jgi:hypothetical protein
MLTTPNPSSGAALGASLGALLSVALLVLAMRGGEATELGMTLAAVLGMPVSLLVTALESLNISDWLLFVAVPLNGALIGAIVGASAHALGWHTRLTFAAIPLLWLGVLALSAWWMRTH